jgi:chromosome partitioning protein
MVESKALTNKKPTTIIAMLNQKGGVGKSSVCFNLGGQFAADGLNTLLVDADPQGSLSQAFYGAAAIENLSSAQTLATIFEDGVSCSDLASLVAPTRFDRLSIIRANQTLAPHNTPEPERLGFRQFAIHELLGSVARFDVVVIDCSPNLYACAWNAMLAADHVIIPVPPEDFGTQGLRAVHHAIANARLLNTALSLLGHVVSRRDGRLLVHRTYEQKLRKLYGEEVFATVVPEASAFKVSLACRTPVSHSSAKSPAARAIAALVAEIWQRASVPSVARRIA